MAQDQPATLPGFESYAVDQPVAKAPVDRSENRAITIDPNQWGGLAKEGAERFPKGEYEGKGSEFMPEPANIPEGTPVYHGSGYPFAEGELIKPSHSKFKGVPNAAYGTTSKEAAEFYANSQAAQEGRLFGSVYTVAPADGGTFEQYKNMQDGVPVNGGYLGEKYNVTGINNGEVSYEKVNDPYYVPYLGSESGLSQQFSHWTYPQAPRD